MKLVLVLLMISVSAYGKVVTKEVLLNGFIWLPAEQQYRLDIHEKAGAYFASKDMGECLAQGADRKSPIKITYDTKTLELSNCEAI